VRIGTPPPTENSARRADTATRVMLVMVEHGPRVWTVRELAEATNMTPGGLHDVLGDLRAAGLVDAEPTLPRTIRTRFRECASWG